MTSNFKDKSVPFCCAAFSSFYDSKLKGITFLDRRSDKDKEKKETQTVNKEF